MIPFIGIRNHGSKPDCQSICFHYRDRLKEDRAAALLEMEAEAFVVVERLVETIYVFVDRSWLAVPR